MVLKHQMKAKSLLLSTYPIYKYTEKKRMQDESSVYRAELAAIIPWPALNWLHQLPALYTRAVILSDSLCSLLSLKTQKEDNFITEILILRNNLYLKGINVSFEWIPGHCDISGNEMADKAAKDALQNPLIDINNKLNKNELNHLLKMYCHTKMAMLMGGNKLPANAVVTPLRKAASYEQRKTNLGSSP